MKYKDLPEHDQPTTRIRELSGSALTTSELLGLALWVTDTETADELSRLYNEYGSLLNIPRGEIVKIKGLGERYADVLYAIAEITHREINRTAQPKSKLHSPADAAHLVRYDMSALDQEEMWIILLDTRNQVMTIEKLYKQTLNSASVRIGEIFKEAIRRNAASIIVCHNHPSGDPNPSPEDVAVTRQVVEAGKLMDIDVLDHLIIGGGQFVSLKQRGLGFN